MDSEVARMIVNSAMLASRQVGELIHLLKAHCDEAAYEELGLSIGKVVYELGELREAACRHSPGLKEQLEENLEKYGRLV